MRKLYVLFLMLLACAGVSAQNDNHKISYQAVVRNAANQLMYDTDLTVAVELANSENGPAVYAETHAVHSNANGLISLLIGDGTYVSGSWDAIHWNAAWVKATISKSGTTLAVHHLPLTAVPFALYADQVNPAALADYLTENHYLTEEVQVLSISHDTVFLTGGSFVKLPAGFSGNYNDLTNKPLKSDLCDSVQECVTGWISDSTRMVYDSLHTYYATTNALKDSLTRYVGIEKLNDTLEHYLQAGALCDSLVKCEVVQNMRDSIRTNATAIAALRDADAALSTRIQNDSANLVDFKTKVKADSITLATRIFDDSTALHNALTDTASAIRSALGDTATAIRNSIGNGTLTIVQGTTELGTFTANQMGNSNITIPTPAEQAQSDWKENNASDPAYIQNKPNIRDSVNRVVLDSLSAANSAMNRAVDTIVRNNIHDSLDVIRTKILTDSLDLVNRIVTDSTALVNRIVTDSTVLADKMHADSLTLANRIVTDSTALVNRIVADSNALAHRMDTLLTHVCDSVETCVKGWISDSTRMIVDSLGAYYDTTLVKKAIHDTADVLRSMMTDAANDAKITIRKNGEEVGDFTVNQAADKTINIPVPTTVAEMTDASDYVKTTKLNDTLSKYATTNALNDSLTRYVGIEKLNDTLEHYLQAGALCDSLVKCEVVQNMRDSIRTNVTAIAALRDADAALSTRIQNDSANLVDFKSKVKADSITLATRIVTDSTALVNRIVTDSLALVNRIVTDSTALADKMHADSLTLATRMDTVYKHLCDSVMACDGIQTMQTDIRNNTTNITALQNKLQSDSAALADKIHSDSLALVNRIVTDSTALADKMHADSLDLVNRIVTDSTALHKAIKDTAAAIRNDICDSATVCITKALADPASEINHAVDTIARNNIHDTAEVLRSQMPVVNDGQLSISVNGGTAQTFTANQSGNTEVNISVPTCDDLADCLLIQDILARLERLEYLNDSLANELDKMKPALTVTGPEKTTVCFGSSKPVTYTATFHNCSSSDYTLAWKVNGADSSNVTASKLIVNVETAGQYEVVCIATRSDNTTVSDTVTTTVTVDNNIPHFIATANNLTVILSEMVYTDTIQWDTDSVPVPFSGTTAEHTYAVADTITITAISEGGCTYVYGLRLQAMAPAVTTVSIPDETITATTAKAYGTVTFDGGIPETKRGMVYSTSNQNLELGAEGVDSVMNGTGMGDFACNLKRLVPCTQYYVCAFAFNDVDTVYGEVKPFTTLSFTCGSTLTDIDGNEYATLLLGSQCWMKQNLRTTHYADGTEIAKGGSSSSSVTQPYYYEPDSNIATYGRFYNWAAAMHGSASSFANPSGVQGVCPDGWHLPSDAEWTQLTNYVASDNANVCGGNPAYIVKSLASTEGWGDYDMDPHVSCRMSTNASSTNNNTGFSVMPAGTWETDGAVADPNFGYTNYGHTIFRSATQHETSYAAFVREFYNEYAYVDRTAIAKTTGLSVRCVLDCATGNSYKPTVSAVTFTDTVGTAISMSASVSSDGGATVTERGVCWGTASQPTIGSNHTADTGTGIGDFTVTATLTPGSTYYVRAYATNSEGTAYGAEMTFVMPNLPTVTTTAATDITAYTATTGGEVTADGGSAVTARGVCWSTSNNPTVDNDTTLNGNGTGSFVASIKNLNPGETYYVRAYATNAVGPAYGDEVTITTPDWSLSLASDGEASIKLCGDPSKSVTYTATPSYGTADDYTYSWSCSGGTISGTPTSNTATITYTSTGTYTVSCTATHNTEHFDVDATISTTIVSGGTKRNLAMCSDGLTIQSKESSSSYVGHVSSISWGDGSTTPNIPYNINFSHTYASPGVYTVTIIPYDANDCEVTRTFAMGDAVLNPCMVAVAHTNSSTYTSSTGGLETTNSEGKITTVADNDGNTYKVAQIGSQCWMAENLRTTKKPDGTEIPVGTTTSSTAAYRYDPLSDATVDPYGYFYNWAAVMNGASASSANPSNVRGICPQGWHVPSDAEWQQMLDAVGTNNAAKLATGCDWAGEGSAMCPNNYRYAERNSSGFDALPAGYYNAPVQFGISTRFWTSSADGTNSYYRQIMRTGTSVSNSATIANTDGYSLRCVRDGGIAEPTEMPTVTTSEATNIGKAGATLNGSVNCPDGVSITERGFDWKPTTGGSYTRVTISDGSTLSYNLTGLTPNTSYTFRAFASTVSSTIYGTEEVFSTLNMPLSLTASPAVDNLVVCTGSDTAIIYTATFTNVNSDDYTISWKVNGTDSSAVTGPQLAVRINASGVYKVTCTATREGYTPLKDSVVTQANVIGSLVDVDGNSYAVQQFGSQCWMTENLRTTKYSNGDDIPLNNVNNFYEPSRFYPNSDAANVSNYGYLYNWTAMKGSSTPSDDVPSGVQGICPSGWHLPSAGEWDIFFEYIGNQSLYSCEENSNNIAKALASTSGWNEPTDGSNCKVGYNQSSNNATGFNAVPAGRFYIFLDYQSYPLPNYYGQWSCFGTSSLYNNVYPYYVYLDYNKPNVSASIFNNYGSWDAYYPEYAVSVRCVRD